MEDRFLLRESHADLTCVIEVLDLAVKRVNRLVQLIDRLILHHTGPSPFVMDPSALAGGRELEQEVRAIGVRIGAMPIDETAVEASINV